MLPVGIAYMAMGAPYYLKRRLNLNVEGLSLKIYSALFRTGIIIFIIGILNFFFNSHWWYIPFIITIGTLVFYTLSSTKKWMTAIEVMDKLEEME